MWAISVLGHVGTLDHKEQQANALRVRILLLPFLRKLADEGLIQASYSSALGYTVVTPETLGKESDQ